MLFSAEAGFIDTTGLAKAVIGDSTYYYSGLFYIRGRKAGLDSIAAFAQEYEESGALPLNKVFGAFCCAVVQPNGDTTFFADNSNLHCFYVGRNAISDSFLELVRYESAFAFDNDSLCEFFALGGVFFGKTLIQGISTTTYSNAYVYSNGSLRVEDKGLGEFDAPTAIADVTEFFRDMAYALSDDKVTLSLTGGYDSRLVLACIMEHLPVNVFISCSDETDPDVYWAGRAATAAGKTLEVLRVGKPQISEAYLRLLLDEADGNGIFVDDNYMRISAFMQDRKHRGYTCYLTGDGGVRHKDWYWLQDLPFYRSKHTKVARFYDQRIQVITPSIPIGRRLEAHYRSMRRRMIGAMQEYVMPINTQSYDSIGFHVQGDLVKLKYSVRSRVVPSYAPLWELELVRYSYHLPRRKRFFYNSMREIITRKSRSLARTPTVYGTTASSEPRYLARDVVFQGIDYSRKAARLLGRRVLRRNLFVGHPTTWSAEADVRALDISRRALGYCVKEELIGAEARQSEIAYSTLGRMIQLYLLAEKMDLWRGGEHQFRRALLEEPVSRSE
jgi:hypothetical protein